jgi:hypothetical protein
MTSSRKIALLVGLVSLCGLLTGCPGMPGGPGAGQENLPPGMKAPPGMEPGIDSGGARTLMGTTITAPENATLLVKLVRPSSEGEPSWRSCRRFVVLDNCVLLEGINYDQRDPDSEADSNEVVPYSDIDSFVWKYQPKPAPPAEEEPPESTDADEGE